VIARGDVLPNRLARQAREHPERPFIRHVDGETWTYAELERRVLAWAGRLHACGVGAGARVVVMLPNSLDSVAVWMAIARLGAIEVPTNTSYRGRFIEHLTNNSGAETAVVAPGFVERFVEVADRLGTLRRLVVVGDPAGAAPGRLEVVAAADVPDDASGATLVEPAAHDVATILYTSGTTGASKGALVPWEQVHATSSACPPYEGRGPEDVYYSPYPLFHMSGKLAICAAGDLGGEVVIREAFSTSRFWDDVDRFGCTTAMLIGAVPVFIAKLPERPDDAAHPLRNVGVAPPPEDVGAFCRRFGVRASMVFNMTELSCPTSTGWDEELLARGSVGRARDGYHVRIVDENDYPLPPGEVGEIVVRSDDPWRLMAGYWAMPEKTAEAWRNLWFHTGDLGRFDEDGALYFLDRKKDAIRRRGENISSMELEAEIAEYEHVAEAAVVGVPSEVGEEDVKAFVVPRGAGFTPEGLIGFLERRVPEFMLPRYVVAVDELPKTPTEKVRKVELKERPVDERTWERPAKQRGRTPEAAVPRG
jgi:crotonobetaine/carnitine-CoA ligase